MKRWIRTIPRLEVVINLEYNHSNVAAADLVNHPTNVKKRNRLDETKLIILNDVVATCVSFIRGAGFPITKMYQSKKSYSYYVRFQPISDDGTKMTPVEIVFRISGDHESNSLDDDVKYASDVIIKSITLGPREYESYPHVAFALGNICDELKKGNISILHKYTFNRT